MFLLEKKDQNLALELIYKILFSSEKYKRAFRIENEDVSKLINLIIPKMNYHKIHDNSRLFDILDLAKQEFSLKLTYEAIFFLNQDLEDPSINDKTRKIFERIRSFRI